MFRHLPAANLESMTFSTKRSASPFPSPTPANECKVVPPIFTAAIPVDAVTATSVDGPPSD